MAGCKLLSLCRLRADAKGNVDDSKVVAALQKAKLNGLPKANIDRVLTQRSNDDKSETWFVEAMGPGKAALLIEVLTDSRIRTQTELRKLIAKNGYVEQHARAWDGGGWWRPSDH